MNQEVNGDLYSILNVSKDSSIEEIKASYKKLCIVFHPDKQLDIEKKEMAERHFQRIQNAYDGN